MMDKIIYVKALTVKVLTIEIGCFLGENPLNRIFVTKH